MAITECISLSAQNKIDNHFSDAALHVNETGYHGTPEFPVAIYLDDVSNKYVNWHWHEEFEIGFVTEGSVILGCGNRNYQMEYGDIFFINSTVLHSMHRNTTYKRAMFKSIAFHSFIISESVTSVFYTRYLFPILSNVNFRECIISKDNSAYQSMLDILENVWNYVYSEDSDYELKVRNELSTLFGILNQLRKNIEETVFLKTPNYLPEKRVQVLLDYIHTHYKDIVKPGFAKPDGETQHDRAHERKIDKVRAENVADDERAFLDYPHRRQRSEKFGQARDRREHNAAYERALNVTLGVDNVDILAELHRNKNNHSDGQYIQNIQ